jgi:hypothetical protein
VTDISGRGVGGVLVRFQVSRGGGWVTDPEVVTDAGGRASTIWYMGPRPGNDNILAAFSPVGSTGYRAAVSPLAPNATYRGIDGYVEMTIGDLPLLFTVPHGGTMTPPGITTRTAPAESDVFTKELTTEISTALGARSRGRPSVVVSHLAVSKVDPDRPIGDGLEGDRIAERTWREYHGFIAAARAYIQDNMTRGLYIDVHGHQLGRERVELGYLLSATDLSATNTVLDDRSFPIKSSIRAIATENHPAFSSILRGDASLGGLLGAGGFPTMPSPALPTPGAGTYLSGGYSLDRYGSRDGSLISGVLLQTPYTGVRDTPANRTRFATAFAASLDEYFTGYFGAALFVR